MGQLERKESSGEVWAGAPLSLKLSVMWVTQASTGSTDLPEDPHVQWEEKEELLASFNNSPSLTLGCGRNHECLPFLHLRHLQGIMLSDIRIGTPCRCDNGKLVHRFLLEVPLRFLVVYLEHALDNATLKPFLSWLEELERKSRKHRNWHPVCLGSHLDHLCPLLSVLKSCPPSLF